MRYLIKFSYDGSCFNGFQRQNGLKTVQGIIEECLSKLDECDVLLVASGRTDKGVHARCQCAHFDLNKKVKLYNLKKYLNDSFNGEIFVFDIENVDDNFHARYDVKNKIYSYYINMGTFDPISRNYIFQYCRKLDISLMKKASLFLLGEHDFRAFCSSEKDKNNCVRKIYNIDFSVCNNILKITFMGNGFLRKMIRNIVGLLLEIGSERLDYLALKDILDSKTRKGNMKCAPACGLYLEEVNY